MKSLIFSLLFAALALVPAAAFGKELNPTAAPDAMNSHTLENIYNRLDTGADASDTEPDAVPGNTGTGYTLNEIMEKAPAIVDDTDRATLADVTKDKTFRGLTSGKRGLRTASYEEPAPTCSGTSYGTADRWCDNGDGTVTDMTTGLVWLENAKCTGTFAGIDNSTGELSWSNAVIWSTAMKSGVCGLTDSSAEGDWRLPTKSELAGITTGVNAVSSSAQQAFGGSVQAGWYWTSTSYSDYPIRAWFVNLSIGYVNVVDKALAYGMWPVRGGQWGPQTGCDLDLSKIWFKVLILLCLHASYS